MEVYTAIYDKELRVLQPPSALLLDETSFSAFLASRPILFCGSGRKKLQQLLVHANALFSDSRMTAVHLSPISYRLYQEEKFSDLAYTEPTYIKDFYSPARKIS